MKWEERRKNLNDMSLSVSKFICLKYQQRQKNSYYICKQKKQEKDSILVEEWMTKYNASGMIAIVTRN